MWSREDGRGGAELGGCCGGAPVPVVAPVAPSAAAAPSAGTPLANDCASDKEGCPFGSG